MLYYHYMSTSNLGQVAPRHMSSAVCKPVDDLEASLQSEQTLEVQSFNKACSFSDGQACSFNDVQAFRSFAFKFCRRTLGSHLTALRSSLGYVKLDSFEVRHDAVRFLDGKLDSPKLQCSICYLFGCFSAETSVQFLCQVLGNELQLRF